MVIKYRLSFSGEDDDYAYLISQILKDTDSNVIKTDNEIIIYMQGDEGSIKNSFALLGERLPISIYVGEQSVEEAAMMPPNRQPLKETSYLATSLDRARELIDERSPRYFELSGNIALNSKPIVGKDALQNALDTVISALKSGKSVGISGGRDRYSLSIATSTVAMLTNLTQPNLEAFGIGVDEAITLSSMERPFVLKSGGNGLGLFCFANDELLLLLSKKCLDCGIDALYFGQYDRGEIFLSHENIKGDAPTRPTLYFNGVDRFFLNQDFAPDLICAKDGALFFDLNIADSFGVYAIKEKGVVKKIVTPSFAPTNPLGTIASRFDFGAKLSSNFENAFEERALLLKNFKSTGDALKDFFECVSLVIGASAGFYGISKLANEADIQGGVKLDFSFFKDEGITKLDLCKTLASIMSFKLGGVEDIVIAYSIFESFVDLLIISQDEAKKSFEYKKLCIGGEFLLSNIFVSKLKSKVKNIDIEMALNRLPADVKALYEIAK